MEKSTALSHDLFDEVVQSTFIFSHCLSEGDLCFQYVLLNDAQRDQRIQVATEKRNKQLEKLTKIKNKKVALRELARKQEQQKQEKQVGFSVLPNRISSLHHCTHFLLVVLNHFTLTSKYF